MLSKAVQHDSHQLHVSSEDLKHCKCDEGAGIFSLFNINELNLNSHR